MVNFVKLTHIHTPRKKKKILAAGNVRSVQASTNRELN